MELNPTLQELGLNEKEASVYLACLQLGSATVQKIAQTAILKRPTTYIILESLLEKGLVKNVPRGTTTEYQAADPQTLVDHLTHQTAILNSLLPTLASLQKRADRPKLQMFEGRRQVLRLYDHIYQQANIWFFGTDMEIFFKNFRESYEKGLEIFKKNHTQTREIFHHKPFDIEHTRNQHKPGVREIRIAPKGIQFGSDNAIWGNSLAITSIQPPFFGVAIESEVISQTFRSLYQMIWNASTPVNQVGSASRRRFR
jgi:sugar-specific transcriptional regulator TrmB